MPAQLGLFGPSLFEAPSSPSPPGFAEREEAIARVREHAPDEWKAAASLAIRFVAARQDEFTTDRVWAVLAERGVTAPAERRAMGAAMRDAAHLGWIAPTNRTEESSRSVCHRRPERIWRSLIRGLQEVGGR